MSGSAPSYDKGPCDQALIESTIGDFFDEVCRRHADNEALVSVHYGLRYAGR